MSTHYEVEYNEYTDAIDYDPGWRFIDNVRTLSEATKTIETHKRIMIDDKKPFPKYRLIKHGIKGYPLRIEIIDPDTIKT